MDKLSIYNSAKAVPDSAKKSIGAGRLKGMTDINPMWRIKKLTELFGPCGIGWWYEITNKQIVFDEITMQKASFVDIMLYFIDPETGCASRGIPGTGGSSFVSQEKSGPYLSDECFKMALTDAISVAAKAIGVGADVYYAADTTKYTNRNQPEQKAPNTPAQTAKPKTKNPTAREILIMKLKERNINIDEYAKEKGLSSNTDQATFLRLLAELEASA